MTKREAEKRQREAGLSNSLQIVKEADNVCNTHSPTLFSNGPHLKDTLKSDMKLGNVQ